MLCVDPVLDFVNEPMVSEPVRHRLHWVLQKLLDKVELLFRLLGGGEKKTKNRKPSLRRE